MNKITTLCPMCGGDRILNLTLGVGKCNQCDRSWMRVKINEHGEQHWDETNCHIKKIKKCESALTIKDTNCIIKENVSILPYIFILVAILLFCGNSWRLGYPLLWTIKLFFILILIPSFHYSLKRWK